MAIELCTEQDLTRMNIRTAWSFAHRLTPDQFDELCRVSVLQLHRDAGCGAPCMDRLEAYEH